MWDFISSESIASLDKRVSSPAFKRLKNNVDTAHGVLMGLAVVLFLPLGALVMRLPGSKNMLWVHAACQIFGLIVLILGFAMGVWTSIIHTEIYTDRHSILGTVIVGLFLIQPALGMIHHRNYASKGRRTIWSDLHVYFGRILLILSIVNGGIGIQYAANSPNGEIGYGVTAGVIFLVYVGVAGLWYMRRPGKEEEQSGDDEVTQVEAQQDKSE